MKKVFLGCLALVLAVVTTTARLTASKEQKRKENSLETDVIDESSKRYITVKFPCGVKADYGNELTPTQVKYPPSVSYRAECDRYYTLVFIGRVHGDAERLSPSEHEHGASCKDDVQDNDSSTAAWILPDPKNCDTADSMYREFLQWLVVNIPGKYVSKGEELAQYLGSGPLKGSGLHRYTFLLYEQPEKLEFNEKRLTNSSISGRDKFCVSEFAEKYCLGEPVAGNYYNAQYDNYVPIAFIKLGARYVFEKFKTILKVDAYNHKQ